MTTALLWSAATTATGQSPAPNQLTAAQKAEGWRLLFNGSTLEGWRGFHRQDVPGGWMVESGTLKKMAGRGTPENPGGDLITIDQFANFEFILEWKISKGGNSGIKYLVSESLPPRDAGPSASNTKCWMMSTIPMPRWESREIEPRERSMI